ncbi:hypothetical protein C0J52_11959 [Blattella germanica]|nr:hypothetical protein C0J52_11959 [Blattella germanica]
MVLLDGKVNSLLEVDYKVERVAEKLDETDNKLAAIGKALDEQKDGPLFGEFTTRGVLSTLKLIERKVDRLQGNLAQHVASHNNNNHHNNGKYGGKTVRHAHGGGSTSKKNETMSDALASGEETSVGSRSGKLVIRCNTPVIVEELLRDVASKVDVIFDKVSRDEDEVIKLKADTLSKQKLWKRMNSPHKKTARALESVEEAVRTLSNTSTALWEDQMGMFEQLVSCCQETRRGVRTFTSDADLMLKKLESVLINQPVPRNDPEPPRRMPDPINPIIPDIESSGDDEMDNRCGGDMEQVHAIEPIVTSSAGSCEDLMGSGMDSGVYRLQDCELNSAGRDFYTRFCDMRTDGGGWTVFQRRGEFPGPRLNFTLPWRDYKNGFGVLTNLRKEVTLRIELESFDGKTAWAEYTNFKIDNEENGYRLLVGGFRGNASDSFSAHDGYSFSTMDRNNDKAPPCCPCVPAYGGGWWYYSCFESNLNGEYYDPEDSREDFRGLIWEHWLGNTSLKKTEMKIRSRDVVKSHDPDFDDRITDSQPDDVRPLDIPEDP